MKILKAKYLLLCDEKFTILQDKSVVFDEKIVEICEFKEALKKYPNSQIYDFSNDIVLPAFINTHTHLEFSANATTLIYGDFIKWVGSIVKSRSKLSKKATQNLIAKQIKIMQKSGVGTIGEISSFGIEAEICAKSGARFVFFNEVLGANESVVEANFANFMARFENSQKFKSDMFIPAVSVHSPYSTHEKLTKKVCEFAGRENLVISTHFLESSHEKKWLESGTGEFKKWLLNFNKNPKPFYTPSEFIAHFKGVKTLFTHCVWADDFSHFDPALHSVTTCVRSNRLLSKKRVNLSKILNSNLSLNIGTDGLSSNLSLNFLDELRANLFMHENIAFEKLARILLYCATNGGAKALGLNLGSIEKGKIADFAVFKGFEVANLSQLPLQLILQSKNAKELFIKGQKCNF